MLKLTFIGHAAFVVTDGTYTIAIDPFITGNPVATHKATDFKPNFIVVTHAHGDHLGDTIELAKTNDATVICINELALWLADQGVKTHPLGIGGGYAFPFGSVKTTIAHHTAKAPNGEYMGEPCGVIINLGGRIIYHTGDTGLFKDMKLIGKLSRPEIMLVPIGDNYTMGIDDAVIAVDFVKPQIAIPMHYNTFPIIQADPNDFVTKLGTLGLKGRVMNFGETIEL